MVLSVEKFSNEAFVEDSASAPEGEGSLKSEMKMKVFSKVEWNGRNADKASELETDSDDTSNEGTFSTSNASQGNEEEARDEKNLEVTRANEKKDGDRDVEMSFEVDEIQDEAREDNLSMDAASENIMDNTQSNQNEEASSSGSIAKSLISQKSGSIRQKLSLSNSSKLSISNSSKLSVSNSSAATIIQHISGDVGENTVASVKTESVDDHQPSDVSHDGAESLSSKQNTENKPFSSDSNVVIAPDNSNEGSTDDAETSVKVESSSIASDTRKSVANESANGSVAGKSANGSVAGKSATLISESASSGVEAESISGSDADSAKSSVTSSPSSTEESANSKSNTGSVVASIAESITGSVAGSIAGSIANSIAGSMSCSNADSVADFSTAESNTVESNTVESNTGSNVGIDTNNILKSNSRVTVVSRNTCSDSSASSVCMSKGSKTNTNENIGTVSDENAGTETKYTAEEVEAFKKKAEEEIAEKISAITKERDRALEEAELAKKKAAEEIAALTADQIEKKDSQTLPAAPSWQKLVQNLSALHATSSLADSGFSAILGRSQTNTSNDAPGEGDTRSELIASLDARISGLFSLLDTVKSGKSEQKELEDDPSNSKGDLNDTGCKVDETTPDCMDGTPDCMDGNPIGDQPNEVQETTIENKAVDLKDTLDDQGSIEIQESIEVEEDIQVGETEEIAELEDLEVDEGEDCGEGLDTKPKKTIGKFFKSMIRTGKKKPMGNLENGNSDRGNMEGDHPEGLISETSEPEGDDSASNRERKKKSLKRKAKKMLKTYFSRKKNPLPTVVECDEGEDETDAPPSEINKDESDSKQKEEGQLPGVDTKIAPEGDNVALSDTPDGTSAEKSLDPESPSQPLSKEQPEQQNEDTSSTKEESSKAEEVENPSSKKEGTTTDKKEESPTTPVETTTAEKGSENQIKDKESREIIVTSESDVGSHQPPVKQIGGSFTELSMTSKQMSQFSDFSNMSSDMNEIQKSFGEQYKEVCKSLTDVASKTKCYLKQTRAKSSSNGFNDLSEKSKIIRESSNFEDPTKQIEQTIEKVRQLGHSLGFTDKDLAMADEETKKESKSDKKRMRSDDSAATFMTDTVDKYFGDMMDLVCGVKKL